MDSLKIRNLVIQRRRECGIGLCGRYDAIARWLFREHKVITTDSWVARVIAEHRDQTGQTHE